MTKIKYRSDIDGLRAIAVILVVFYHVGFGFFSGGFIGVDVFFVISGYLITTIIKSEVESKTFSLSRFFARRIKRIVPGLFVVLVASSAAAWLILFPKDFLVYSDNLLATSISLSNYFLVNHASGYFSLSVEQLPLLHTWSLSVEEQFYIIWPVAYLLIFRKMKGIIAPAIAIVTSLILVSCVYSSILILKWPAASYYSLFSRAFEILLGCLVALIPNKTMKWNGFLSYLSTLSLIVIAICSIIISKESYFPGAMALVPCVAAALFILGGVGDNKGFANVLLSNKVAVYIGKLSYPIYLWHWPIVSYLNYNGIEKTNSVSFLILISTFILSVITYHFVELPVKEKVRSKFSITFFTMLFPMMIFSFSVSYMIKINNGFEWRFGEIKAYLNPSNNPEVVRNKCFNSYDLSENGFCQLGVRDGKSKGIFIGDSMAGHYMAFIDFMAKDAGVTVFGSASSGLPPVYDVKSHPESAFQRKYEMLSYNKKRMKIAHSFDFVILAAGWGNGYPYFESEKAIDETIKEFVNSGIKVYIILRPNGLEREMMKRALFTTARHGSIARLTAPLKPSVNGNIKHINQSRMIKVIDPNDVLCKNGECDVSIDGELIYIDKDHITEFGSKALASRYLSEFHNPLKSVN